MSSQPVPVPVPNPVPSACVESQEGEAHPPFAFPGSHPCPWGQEALCSLLPTARWCLGSHGAGWRGAVGRCGAWGLQAPGEGQCMGQRVWGEPREGIRGGDPEEGTRRGPGRRKPGVGDRGDPMAGDREPSGSAAPLSQPLPKHQQSPPKAPSEPPPLQPCSPKGGWGAVSGCPVCWDPSGSHRYSAKSHRAQLLALPGEGEHGWVCATEIPPPGPSPALGKAEGVKGVPGVMAS